MTITKYMRSYRNLFAVCALVVICGSTSAQAALITTLFNTGVNGAGVSLPNGSPETHYSLLSVPSGSTSPEVLTSAGGFPIPPWIADSAVSAWISPANAGDDDPAGVYTFRTTFTLASFGPGFTASITGRWATDDGGLDILINGISTGQTSSSSASFTSFSILSGFVQGSNTLDFVVRNNVFVAPNPVGLRVEMTGDVAQTGNVPEPTTLAIWGLGALGCAMAGYRRRKLA